MDILAWGILRASDISMEKVNSAVEMVLPPGVFMTTMPRWVAVSTSTLSTPTPARPTTRRLGAASMTFLVILVSERTTMACMSLTKGKRSASAVFCFRTVTLNSGRCWSSAMPLGEIGSQTKIFIKWTANVGQTPGAVNIFGKASLERQGCSKVWQQGLRPRRCRLAAHCRKKRKAC